MPDIALVADLQTGVATLFNDDSIEPIGFPDITPALARASGFLGVLDLLKVAKHGRGENIYLIRFHYIRPRGKRIAKRKPKARLR